MVLKNKDGSVYKLQGPNPTMKDQNLWGDFVAHNMNWQEEKIRDVNQKKNKKQVVQPPENNFIQELEATKSTKEKTADQEKSIEVIQEKPIEIKSTTKEDSQIKKTYIYLLPAIRKIRKDDFYGDSCVTLEYKDPTSFEGVIIKQSDVYFEVWTDVQDIGIGSVLYPKSNIKRWWRVQEIVPKASGWLLSCSISDYQPAFKD